ncbi:hypothetical protein [Butyrivibrio fibrisolvens]|uniref:hypothetical protein n=1 Tax=Butyrivibrio fibrisolvens TaxID=831 RepID=UPI0004807869|nr:hypothetical protein [Butyrivibrio fibrisolvens]
MEDIIYTKDGRVKTKSGNAIAENELNYILNLNGRVDKNGSIISDTATNLVRGRRGAYSNYQKIMQKMSANCKNEKILANEIEKLIDKIEKSDEYPEFAGVILYFLKRRLVR